MLKVTADTLALLASAGDLDFLVRNAGEIIVSPTIAAALTGRSPEALRAAVDNGALGAFRQVHRRIGIDALQAWHGRPIDAETWRRAAKTLSRSRSPEDTRHKLVSEDERHAA